MKVCPNCNIEFDDLQNFCVQCGKKLDKERIGLGDLNNRLKRMEESLSRMDGRPTARSAVSTDKNTEEMRLSLLERINHNSDALEKLSERLKEMDGITGEGRKKIQENIGRIIGEESRNIGSGVVSDLRKESQNIKSKVEELRANQNRLKEQIDEIKKGMEQIESRVSKSIYKELTRSLVK